LYTQLGCDTKEIALEKLEAGCTQAYNHRSYSKNKKNATREHLVVGGMKEAWVAEHAAAESTLATADHFLQATFRVAAPQPPSGSGQPAAPLVRGYLQ
jgi:hypothetical protein